MTSPRTIAVDWSGAIAGVKKKIWLAEASDGELLRLECGRDRDQVIPFLIAESLRTPELVVGLDFAFSLPAWYIEELGLGSAYALWDCVSRDGEVWLASCEHPFWGRPGRAKPILREDFRVTDRSVRSVAGIRPKSVFQIGGAGAVGTGSLRGMPYLKRLRDAGFAIWPFDAARLPLVVEIYPRLLTGPVNKGSQEARESYLERRYSGLDAAMLRRAASSEDAFDAAVSALAMNRVRDSFAELPESMDPFIRIEGQIWAPTAAIDLAPVPETRLETRRASADVALDQRAWRSLISTMLPSPVVERRANCLVGGDPPEVVVEMESESIRVLQFAVRWVGHTPEPNDQEIARFDPRRSTPQDVARAVMKARAGRIATYGWCSGCRQINPPERMHSRTYCQSCAEKQLGIVY